MSLTTLPNYWTKKSIKLSDAFEVLLTEGTGKEPKPLVHCTGFTIPKLEYEEETLEYGNVAQVFLTPKYDSCKELTLEFMEHMVNKNYSAVLSKVFEYMGYTIHQTYNNSGLQTNNGVYNINKVLPIIDIKILDNKLWKYIYKYHFENLKVVNYSIYNLENQGETPCKVSVTLSFETFKKEIINENVVYGDSTYGNKNQQKKKDDKEKQKEAPTKDDITQQWKNDMNKQDLDMIKNEPLYNPSYEPLPDLDEEMSPELAIESYQNSMNDSDLDMIKNEQLYNPSYEPLPDLDGEMDPELAIETYQTSMNESDLDMIRYPELEELNAMEREIEMEGMKNTSTTNSDLGPESVEVDWRQKAYEAQQAAKGNRSPNLTQNPNPETINNFMSTKIEANKIDTDMIKKQMTKNEGSDKIIEKQKSTKDSDSLTRSPSLGTHRLNK